jgi:8-oxo-dGTP pyrophosphatase MutT (NUDIX family)
MWIMLETIRKNLAAETRSTPQPTKLTRAAVLLPLLYQHGALHILFTKRTTTVKAHKGQVSFPGGVHDPHDESLLATALRESGEEIGLQSQDIELLGALEPISTVTTGFLVHTFVGLIPYPYPFQLNSREVAEILVVPVSFLADARQWSRRTFRTDNRPLTAYFIAYDDHLIWGATARILKNFLELNGIELNIRSDTA